VSLRINEVEEVILYVYEVGLLPFIPLLT